MHEERSYDPVFDSQRHFRILRITDKRGRKRYIGQVLVTESEMVSQIHSHRKGTPPHLLVGYGLCFGHNETKAISMGLLDHSPYPQREADPGAAGHWPVPPWG